MEDKKRPLGEWGERAQVAKRRAGVGQSGRCTIGRQLEREWEGEIFETRQTMKGFLNLL